MNTTRIQNTLENLFQDSARWSHSERRVVFWYDPEQQFTSVFNELQLDGAEKIQLADTPFTVKYSLLSNSPTKIFYYTHHLPNQTPKITGCLIFKKAV